jgi:hypothetical protein
MKLFDARQKQRVNRFDGSLPNSILSIDPMVWPSIFNSQLAPGFTEEKRCSLGYSTRYPTPEWIGGKPPFWDDLETLCSTLKQNKIDLSCYEIIMVSDDHTGNLDQWQFAGFDVLTDYFISGVSNFFPNTIKNFKKSLNRNFLFEEKEDARKYMECMCHADHSEWQILGLWVRNEVERTCLESSLRIKGK